MTSRRCFTYLLSSAAASLLSSCGTIIYPDRVNQEERGNLDPAVIILDGIGLFFFLIPGVIAFAVDFATGAIYLPSDKDPDDQERTIFDDLTRFTPNPGGKLGRHHIEHVLSRHTGLAVDLLRKDIRTAEMAHPGQFWQTYERLSGPFLQFPG